MSNKPWCLITVSPGVEVKVDEEDLGRLNEHRWRVTKGSTGRPRIVTSIRTGKKVRSVTLGKFLLDPTPGQQVYPRRFHDGLDYRKENLIACSLSERQRMLPKKRPTSTSSYRGVSFNRTEGKWRAGIEVEGRSINIGQFESEQAAALAYNEAAQKYFGVRAYQNRVFENPDSRQGDDGESDDGKTN